MMGYTAPTPPSPAAGAADSGEFTIDQEVPALAPAETEEDEFQIEEELAAAPQPVASDEFALEEEPAPAEPAASEEFALEEEPLAEVEPDSESNRSVRRKLLQIRRTIWSFRNFLPQQPLVKKNLRCLIWKPPLQPPRRQQYRQRKIPAIQNGILLLKKMMRRKHQLISRSISIHHISSR